jgi:hypothetical protein
MQNGTQHNRMIAAAENLILGALCVGMLALAFIVIRSGLPIA